LNNNIQWKNPTDEVIKFVQRHWFPELERSSYYKKEIGVIKRGELQVACAYLTKIVGNNTNCFINAKLLLGEYVMSKKGIWPKEKMVIKFPMHFT